MLLLLMMIPLRISRCGISAPLHLTRIGTVPTFVHFQMLRSAVLIATIAAAAGYAPTVAPLTQSKLAASRVAPVLMAEPSPKAVTIGAAAVSAPPTIPGTPAA